MQLRESIKRYLREQCFMNPNSPPTYGNYGCMDPTALNFDLAATHPCSSGYPSFACANCNSQPDYCGPGTGVGQCCIYPTPILGCTDPTACNYDPSATIDDGSCEYTSCMGCTDSTASNFNVNATIDDGSCVYPIAGCTDPEACNGDPLAVIDDGSCEYTSCMGCTDSNAINFDSNATISCPNCCIYPINGCTDQLAFNYDPLATMDDGSCVYDTDLELCCEWCNTYNPQIGGNPPPGCKDWMCNNSDYCPPEITSENPCDEIDEYVVNNYTNWSDPNQGGTIVNLNAVQFCEHCKSDVLVDPMCTCCKKDPCDKIPFIDKVNMDYGIEIIEFCKYCSYDLIQDSLCKCCKRFEKIKPIRAGIPIPLGEEIKLIKRMLK